MKRPCAGVPYLNRAANALTILHALAAPTIALILLLSNAAPAATGAARSKSREVYSTPPEIVERGTSHRRWQTIHHVTNRLGGAVKVTAVTNGYTELQSGLCYVDPAGVWRDSVAEIVLLPDGTAEATRLPHKVRFAADLAAADAIRVTLPTGEQMHSTLRGLVLYDPVNRVSTEVARVDEGTLGYLLGTNRIAYSNAFRAAGIWGDVIYTVSPAGLEQDVALHTAPELKTLATAAGISQQTIRGNGQRVQWVSQY